MSTSLTQSELDRLAAHVTEEFPSLSSEERRELVQLSVEHALEAVPAASGETLIDAAIHALPEVASKMRSRRGQRVAQPRHEIAEHEKPEPTRRAHGPRMPHTSKGIVSVMYPGGDIDMIPIEVGDPLGDIERVMLHRISSEIVTPLESEGLISPERREALLDAYGELFGAPPEHAWAQILVEEIRRAKLDKLASEARAATGAGLARTSQPAEKRVSASLTLTAKGRVAFPEMPTNQTLTFRSALERVAGESATLAFRAELNGETRVVGRMVGQLRSEPIGPRAPYAALPRANEVLVRAIERLAHWPGPLTLPEYVLDEELIAIMVERMGFDGGGGPRRVLSAQRVLELLVDPAGLAAELESYGATIADRLHEENAEKVEQNFREIVSRIRERAGVGPAHAGV